MIRQRLRGVLGTTIAACIPWTALGLVTGVVFQFDLIPGVHAGLGRPVPGGFLTVCTLVGAVVGIVNGLTFSGVVLAAERGKKVEELRGWRVALWSALATAGTLGLFFQEPVVASIGALAGAVGGIAALWMARRPQVKSAQSPSTIA